MLKNKQQETIMKKNILKKLFAGLLVGALALTGCQQQGDTNMNSSSTDMNSEGEKIKVVATTTMLADMAEQIGKDKVEVSSLMGPGIDPHLYKASAGDYSLMEGADLVVYNGLHLEGKMGDIFSNLKSSGKEVVLIADNISESQLLEGEEEAENEGEVHQSENDAMHVHDPHIWFDVMLWKEASQNLYDGLVRISPENEAYFKENFEAYKKSLDEIHQYSIDQIALIPQESRVLITAHDAFSYFGRAYGFEVRGLQGISTTSEAGTKDVAELADFIVERKIKAIFIESSVPKKNVEALQEAVKAKGFEVAIGGELFSDSLGSDEDTKTYVGTIKSNIDTIVGALK